MKNKVIKQEDRNYLTERERNVFIDIADLIERRCSLRLNYGLDEVPSDISFKRLINTFFIDDEEKKGNCKEKKKFLI
jgi:hypothetical protein